LPLARDALILASELIFDMDYAGGFGKRRFSAGGWYGVKWFGMLGKEIFSKFVTGLFYGFGCDFNAETRRRRGAQRKRVFWAVTDLLDFYLVYFWLVRGIFDLLGTGFVGGRGIRGREETAVET
jgi:hypothetical protein